MILKQINIDDCWLYAGAKNSKGYGQITYRIDANGSRLKLNVSAHRTMYEVTKGNIPEGLTIDHLCNIPCCINPEHLEAVTNAVNIQRAFERRDSKNVCRRGHVRTKDNIILRRDGRITCKDCYKAYKRKFHKTKAYRDYITRPDVIERVRESRRKYENKHKST